MITDTYFNEILKVLNKIHDTQAGKILLAAKAAAETINQDGIIYIFGCGHSHLVALDSFYRAGGLANVSAILDTDLMLHNGAAKSSAMEKMSGIAEKILERYCLTQKDLLIVVSTSGVNAVPVEMVQEARKLGVCTVAVTSLAYKNKNKKHLLDCADIYIDNCVPHGDVTVQIKGCDTKMGSVSTAVSSFIVQSVILETAELCAAKGVTLPVYMSGNVEGGPEYNSAIIKKYLPRIKHL